MCGGFGRAKGIFEGLCHAMKPKMKTMAAPALTASANSGLRPPAADSKTMAAAVQKCLRIARQAAVEGVWA
jgi:hypothetical protein